MNLKEEVLKSDFKDQVVSAAEEIGTDKQRFADLMELFFSTRNIYAQRASWVMSHCTDLHPELLDPHLNRMVKNLYNDDIGNATKRNSVRALQFIEIPKRLWGKVIDICFRFLMGNEAVAIKVFSMTVLYNLSLKLPEISNELKVVIEDQLPYGTAGFKSRGKKILRSLEKVR
jgi:hypothetical protein